MARSGAATTARAKLSARSRAPAEAGGVRPPGRAALARERGARPLAGAWGQGPAVAVAVGLGLAQPPPAGEPPPLVQGDEAKPADGGAPAPPEATKQGGADLRSRLGGL